MCFIQKHCQSKEHQIIFLCPNTAIGSETEVEVKLFGKKNHCKIVLQLRPCNSNLNEFL